MLGTLFSGDQKQWQWPRVGRKPGVTDLLYDAEGPHSNLALHQGWTAAMAELGKGSEIVKISEEGAPTMSVRTLARMSSDPDADMATHRALIAS